MRFFEEKSIPAIDGHMLGTWSETCSFGTRARRESRANMLNELGPSLRKPLFDQYGFSTISVRPTRETKISPGGLLYRHHLSGIGAVAGEVSR